MEPVFKKEGVYFAFPFAMTHPQFQYEIQNGVVDPAKDMYPGAGHEWFSIQHWISVQQDGLSATVMPLDAPLATFGDINRGEWPTEFGQQARKHILLRDEQLLAHQLSRSARRALPLSLCHHQCGTHRCNCSEPRGLGRVDTTGA